MEKFTKNSNSSRDELAFAIGELLQVVWDVWPPTMGGMKQRVSVSYWPNHKGWLRVATGCWNEMDDLGREKNNNLFLVMKKAT